VDLLWATYWPVTIHMGLPVYLFLFQNWNISANISLIVFAVDRVISSARLGATLPFDVHVTLPARFRVIDGVISTAQLGATLPFDVQVTLPASFRVIDGMISSAQLGATLPFDVRVTLPARFRVNLYTALWVNKFVTLLWVNDRVILPAQVWDILPIDVQVILPACFRVNLSIALWVNKFATPLWVNDRVVSPVQVQAMLPAHFVVNLHTTLQWVNDKGNFNNVQLDDHAVQRFFSYQHTIMHSMDDYSLLPKKYMCLFREIQQNSMMLQIIHILFSIQINLNSQVSVKLSKAMHIIFYSTV